MTSSHAQPPSSTRFKHARLTKDFFSRHVVDVAQDLLGKTLVFGDMYGIITETEAYRGSDDPASHAFSGPTPRSYVMFGEPGYSYVYKIYGMYYCLNIISEPHTHPAGVLIRGLQVPGDIHLDGPGKLCRYLKITTAHNALDLTIHPNFFIAEGLPATSYTATSRIGIKKGLDKRWRFVMTPEAIQNILLPTRV